MKHSAFAKHIAAIKQTLERRNYSLVVPISNADHQEELNAAQKLLGVGADASILSGAAHHTELLEKFERRTVPYVQMLILGPVSSSPIIGYDNATLAAESVRFMSSLRIDR